MFVIKANTSNYDFDV